MRTFKLISILFAVAVVDVSCRPVEKIDPNIDIPGLGGHEYTETELDVWLQSTFLDEYNIDVVYHWDAVRMYADNADNKLVPVKTELVRPMMETIAKIWFQPFLDVADYGFLQKYTPKTIILAGSPEYQKGGAIVLGTAEGAVKIFLTNANAFSATNRSVLVDYMHVIEHEFTHILNQNVAYDPNFQLISSGDYEPSTWMDYESDDEAWMRGFLSTYGMSTPAEDYAEILSLVLVHGMDWFENTVIPVAEESTVDPEADEKLREKLASVSDYMLNSFGINMHDDPVTGENGFVTHVQEAIDYVIEEALAGEL